MHDYDVVIVGGRPAGATLAARLGKRGLRVLVVDRASFPSLPGVPSSPVLHPGTMRVLDELGIDEAKYRHCAAPMYGMSIEFHTYFSVRMQMPKVWGRDYVCGIDRSQFDCVLWEHLAQFPSVTRRSEFAVTDLIREGDGRVVGILGAAHGEEPTKIYAPCVVGADGRFSLVARKAGAAVKREDKVHVSTVHYADWEGVKSFHDEGPAGVCVYVTGRGLDIPMFRMPGGRTSVNIHMRADRAEIGGDAQRYYEGVLKSQPRVWRLLESARQVNSVVGIKRIGNGYRQAFGAGWVLVGDALHYKDPVDAQGIYDALIEGRFLDEAIAAWRSGRSFAEAMADYERAVDAATLAMFEETVSRLKRELYQEPPVPVIKTAMRWLLSDPVYQQRFLHYLSRAIPNDRLMTPALVAGALLRGIGGDLRQRLRAR